MSDQRTVSGGSPWMRPLSAQQLVRKDPSRRTTEPVGTYTPNEPDQNEAIYAARAKAAISAQRPAAPVPSAPAEPISTPVSTPTSENPIEQAMRSTVAQIHTARQEASHPSQETAMPSASYLPTEFFYRQSTGVLQPEPEAPKAAIPPQPAQPHRLPMVQYSEAAPAAEPAPQTTYAFASRLPDAAPLTDPLLAEEASQESAFPHRRTVLMRTQQPNDVDWYALQQETVSPVQAAPEPTVQAEQEPCEPLFANLDEPAPQPADLPPLPQQSQWDADFMQPLLDPSQPTEEDEDEGEEDCMDTDTMPIPAPISPFMLPPDKPKRRFPVALVLLPLMLIATGVFLWFSGYGAPLLSAAKQLWETHVMPFVQSIFKQ